MDRRVGFTVDDYLSLPDDAPRCELVEGVFHVTPAPNRFHQDVASTIHRRLRNHCKRRRCGKAMSAPFDVVLGDATVVQPDVLFVSRERRDAVLGDPRRAHGAPDLVVEVLSPSTSRYDRTKKRKAYSMAGVRELWLVDVVRRTVEVWTPGPRGLTRRRTLRGREQLAGAVVPGYRVRVDLFFEDLDD